MWRILTVDARQRRVNGVIVRLPPQPFRLLLLLASRAGQVVSREEIRKQLWGEDTFVDFDQGVNFSIRQIREALGDSADESRYVRTIPRRGYKFLLPIEPLAGSMTTGTPAGTPASAEIADGDLHKVLWANIAEMRIAEQRRRRMLIALTTLILLLAVLLALKIFL